ncbi:MAG: hypothetical protein AB1733_02515 [Thermodesulfobacteriota bacterium]
MMRIRLDPPEPDEIEVTVFGPGYGEAIAIHLGDGKWVSVDSCTDPESGRPAVLTYLHGLRVDVSVAVKLIVATHWHDDHIRGLGRIFDESRSATVAISSALGEEEFLSLAELYDEPRVRHGSGIREFNQVKKTLEDRRLQGARFASPKWALADRLLYQDQIRASCHAVQARVFALSPSDAAYSPRVSKFTHNSRTLWKSSR